jgi:hypothetical protein
MVIARRYPVSTGNIFLLLLALTAAACTPAKKEANVNLTGYPPAFRAGYLDGCDTSKRTSGRTRDEERFKHDSQYASGWRDGNDICTRQQKTK